MSGVRFFTDEDVFGDVAPALRRAGVDAISTPDASRLSKSHDAQLEWAALSGRSIVTFNVGHFVYLHSQRLSENRHHAGIVVSQQRTIGDMIRRLIYWAGALDGEAMCDRVEFLSDW